MVACKCQSGTALAIVSLTFATCVASEILNFKRLDAHSELEDSLRNGKLEQTMGIFSPPSRLKPRREMLNRRQEKLKLSVKHKAWHESLPYIYKALWPRQELKVCFVILLAQALGTRALFGISKFVDEACCYRFTQTLAAIYGNSMQLVATIIYILSYHFYLATSADGRLDPPSWVEYCAIIIVAGIELRMLAAMFLCLLRDPQKIRNLPPSQRMPVGEPINVYKTAAMYKYSYPWIPSICFIMSGVAEALFLVGALGIFMAFLLAPLNISRVAPSLLCALIMSVLYITLCHAIDVTRMVWAVLDSILEIGADISGVHVEDRHREAAVGEWWSVLLDKVERSCLAAAATTQKGIALGIIYLFTWLRQLRTHPPYGLPTPGMRLVAFLTTGALLIEVVLSAGAGATSEAAAPTYFGAAGKSTSARILHGIKNSAGLIAVLGIVPTLVRFVHELPDWNQGRAAMICALSFAALYYFVHGLELVVTNFYYCVGRTKSPSLSAAIEYAADHVAMSPLLALLYALCWSRAAYITNGTGSPQGWAQELMIGSAVAKAFQVLPNLLAPAFASGSTRDADGIMLDSNHPTFAYILTILDSISFIYGQVGAFGVLLSLFLVTPETATSEVAVGTSLRLFVGICLFAILVSIGKLIGLTVKFTFNSFSEDGEEIHLGSLCVSVPLGYVCIQDLSIPNPEEISGQCRSTCILEMALLHLKVGVWPLIRSFGKTLSVEAVVLHGLALNYEVPPGRGKSNVGTLVSSFKRHAKEMREASNRKGCLPCFGHAEGKTADEVKAEDIQKNEQSKNKKPLTFYMPHFVSIEDIHVNVDVWKVPERIWMQDININDFKGALQKLTGEKVGIDGKPAGKAEIVKVGGAVLMWILQSLVKSATAEAVAIAQSVPFCGNCCISEEALRKEALPINDIDPGSGALMPVGKKMGASFKHVREHVMEAVGVSPASKSHEITNP